MPKKKNNIILKPKPVNNSEVDFKHTWVILLGIISALFLVVAIIMFFFNQSYVIGLQYLITSALFVYAINSINSKKIVVHGKFQNLSMFLMGFTFIALGLTLNPILWAIGIVFFILSLASNN